MTIRDQFDRLVAAYIGAVEAGDAEAVARLYTEDAFLINPGHLPIRGRRAIEDDYRENLGDGYRLTVNVLDFQDQGELAHAVGTYETEYGNGNWLEVLQRQSDGSLLLHRVCTNSH